MNETSSFVNTAKVLLSSKQQFPAFLFCAPAEGGFHDRSMEYFKRGLEAAEKMGAKKLLTNCIGAPFDEEYNRAYDRAVRSLKELSKTAADHGITIAVETVRPRACNWCENKPSLFARPPG